MTDGPRTAPILSPGAVALTAVAALIALSVAGGTTQTAAGCLVLAAAALTLAIVSVLAILVGRTERWLRAALAVAIACASAGTLVRCLGPQEPAEPISDTDQGPATAVDDAGTRAAQPEIAVERIEDLEARADDAVGKQDLPQATRLLDQAVARLDAEAEVDLPRRDALLRKLVPLLAAAEDTPGILERIAGHLERLDSTPSPDFAAVADWADEAGRFAGASGNLEASVGWFRRAIAARDHSKDHVKAAFARVNLAMSLGKLGRKDEALAVLGEALPVLDGLPEDHPARGTARAMAAELGN